MVGVCASYLLTVLAVKEYPAQFYDFRGVLGDIYAMLVAGCGNMDNHIPIQLRDGDSIAGHAGGSTSLTGEILEDVARCCDLSVSNMQRGDCRCCGCGDILQGLESLFESVNE
jgi:hypothetical protein